MCREIFLRKTVALVGEQPHIHLEIARLSQLSERLPKDYTARNGHIERMFGPRLGNLDRAIAQINGRLIDAKDLIAKDQTVAHSTLGTPLARHLGTLDLLDSQHAHTLLFEGFDALDGR